jgi:hypothetical protein
MKNHVIRKGDGNGISHIDCVALLSGQDNIRKYAFMRHRSLLTNSCGFVDINVVCVYSPPWTHLLVVGAGHAARADTFIICVAA